MLTKRAILQRVFDLLYTRFAWAYDTVSRVVSFGRWQSWGKAALPYLAGTRVLELGHGPGHLLVTLESGGWVSTGIDPSPQMGRQARRRMLERGLSPRLARGRAPALPFASHSFDCVVATFPAPYIVEPETARAIHRVLRPGGRLIIVPEAELTGADPASHLLEWLFRITGQRSPSAQNRNAPPEIWEKAFAPAGFAIEVHRVPQPGSIVIVVIADRRSE